MAEWLSTNTHISLSESSLDKLGWGLARTWYGTAALAWTDAGLCWLDPDPSTGCEELICHYWLAKSLVRDDKCAAQLAHALSDSGLAPSLHLRGTEFQLSVWRQLLTIPSGQTISYGQLADQAGLGRSSARAVGSAVAANRVAIAVPCHRVLPESGGIGEFRWGSEFKSVLLTHEGALQATADRHAA
jgi:AraC family transcriptional regulator of adaptative response/methylated-DNA-[protein]-cysteine methyltransferase